MRQGEIALILDIHTSLPRKAVELYRNGNGGCKFSLLQISCTGTRQTTSSAECEMTQRVLRNRPVETIRKGGGREGGTKALLHINISLPRETVALANVGSIPDQIRMSASSLADKCVMRITRWCSAMHLWRQRLAVCNRFLSYSIDLGLSAPAGAATATWTTPVRMFVTYKISPGICCQGAGVLPESVTPTMSLKNLWAPPRSLARRGASAVWMSVCEIGELSKSLGITSIGMVNGSISTVGSARGICAPRPLRCGVVGNLLPLFEQQVAGMPALASRRLDCFDEPMHVRHVGGDGSCSALWCSGTSTCSAMLSMVALRLCSVNCRACSGVIRAFLHLRCLESSEKRRCCAEAHGGCNHWTLIVVNHV